MEPGDEGSPMVDQNARQVGVVVGSWQVNPNTTDVITFATLGPAIAPNLQFIETILQEQPVGTSVAATVFVNFAAAALLLYAALL